MASNSADSTVSAQKASTSYSDDNTSSKREVVIRRNSTDTVCSSNSSCFLKKRKVPHPFANNNASAKAYRIRDTVTSSRNNNTSTTVVRQRVLSARLLKLRSVQSQLNDANFHLSELAKENRALKTLQKRQDRALLNYEGVNAELPRLIKSHEEEIRTLRERNKTLRRGLKEAADHLKMKEDELHHVKEQLKMLNALAKDKHLGERGKLSESLEDVKNKLSKSETQINLLNRKLMLEAKNYKFRLNAEMTKYKESQKQLTQAIAEIGRLTNLLEGKSRTNVLSNHRKIIGNHGKRQSISLISLSGNKSVTTESPAVTCSDTFITEEVSEELNERIIKLRNSNSNSDLIKLEPIVINNNNYKRSEETITHLRPSLLPLTRQITTGHVDEVYEAGKILNNLNINDKKDNKEVDDNFVIETQQKSIYTLTRPSSSSANPLDSTTCSEQQELETVLEQRLGDYCTQAFSTVNMLNAVSDQHKEQYELSKTETEKLMRALKKTNKIEAKLKQTNAHNNYAVNDNNDNNQFVLPTNDVDIINKILDDELEFQKCNNNNNNHVTTRNVEKSKRTTLDYFGNNTKTDTNGNVTTTTFNSNVNKDAGVVNLESKRKLLATLKAIDNGESLDEDDVKSKRMGIMNELFGSNLK